MIDKDKGLSLTESSNFHYLLELMIPLYGIDEYGCLPELFSIIGHEKLLVLAKYAGGSTVRIPTLEEVSTSLQALEWYYEVYIKHTKTAKDIPYEFTSLVERIRKVIDVRGY